MGGTGNVGGIVSVKSSGTIDTSEDNAHGISALSIGWGEADDGLLSQLRPKLSALPCPAFHELQDHSLVIYANRYRFALSSLRNVLHEEVLWCSRLLASRF